MFACISIAALIFSTRCNKHDQEEVEAISPVINSFTVLDNTDGVTRTQIVCVVDEKRLSTLGVSQEDLKIVMRAYFEAIGTAISSAGADAVAGDWSNKKTQIIISSNAHEGLRQLLIEGIECEIHTQEGDKNAVSKKSIIRFNKQE